MKDSEFIELRNRFLLGVFIALLVVIPFFIVIIVKLDQINSKIIKRLNAKESFYILVESSNCKNCREVESTLKDNELSYEKINIEKEEYEEILEKLHSMSLEVSPPAILFIQNGTMVEKLTKINENDELEEFINNIEKRW
ncbi:MAG: hypothetical protein IKE70_06420 [Bacilli bacterium]|nr:hypothetical protein [Bacilli bacterium]